MNITRDTLWCGRLCLWQPARKAGYRFALDPILLAAFVETSATNQVVLDLGTGCGVLAILLLASGKARQVIAVEWQQELAVLAAKNAVENGFAKQMQVIHADIRTFVWLSKVDHVVFNPPYFTNNCGAVSPNPSRALARHGGVDVLHAFVGCAVRHLHQQGRISSIIHVQQHHRYMKALDDYAWQMSRQQWVQTRSHLPAHAVLIESVNDSNHPLSCLEKSPCIVHQTGSANFTNDVKSWICGPS